MRNKVIIWLSLLVLFLVSIPIHSQSDNNLVIDIDGLNNLYEGGDIIFRILMINEGKMEEIITIDKILIFRNNSLVDERQIGKTLIGIGDYINNLNVDKKVAVEAIPKGTHIELVVYQKGFLNANDKIIMEIKGVHKNEKTGETYDLVKRIEREIKFQVSPKMTLRSLHEYIYKKKGVSPMTIEPGEGWYVGDLHVHSAHSEHEFINLTNIMPPTLIMPPTISENAQKARNISLDFISITDHSVDINNGWCGAVRVGNGYIPLPCCDAWGIFPQCIISKDEWNNYILPECEAATTSDFLCIRGEEIGIGDHFPLINSNFAYGGPDPEHCSNWETLFRNIKLIEASYFGFTAHPFCKPDPLYDGRWGCWETQNWDTEGLAAMEIWNYGSDKEDSDSTTNAIKKWVELLLKGKRVVAVGNSDAHRLDDIGKVFNAVYIGKIDDNAGGMPQSSPVDSRSYEKYDKETLVSALRAGHVYVSNGPALVLEAYSYSENGMMGDTIRSTHPIIDGQKHTISILVTYNVEKSGFIYLYKGIIGESQEVLIPKKWPALVGVSGEEYVSFYDNPTQNSYYRVEFISNDKTQRAFTNPIWVIPSARLFLEKEGPEMAAPGSVIEYTITIRNDGKLAAKNVQLREKYPKYTRYLSSTREPGIVNELSRELIWDFAELHPSESVKIKVKIKLNDIILHGTRLCSETLLISEDPSLLLSDYHCLFVQAEGVRIYVHKGGGGSERSCEIVEGEYRCRTPIVLIIALYNYGSVTAHDLVVSDPIEFSGIIDWDIYKDNPEYEYYTNTFGKEKQIISPGNVTWYIERLPPGIEKQIGVLLKPVWTATLHEEICNKAYVQAGSVSVESNEWCEVIIPPPTPPISDDNACCPILKDPPSFIKTVSSSEAYRGEILKFTLEINNLGSGSAYNVTWIDNQPMYLDYLAGTSTFELYDTKRILKSWGKASDPMIIHNNDGSTTLVFGNIVPKISPGETLKIFYESKIPENAPEGITLINRADIVSYCDANRNVYTDGASSQASIKVKKKDIFSRSKKIFSFEPLASNTMNNCCLPKREEALRLLSEAKEKNLDIKEVELILKEADSFFEKAKAFYNSENYIAANNHALKACEMYKKAQEMLKIILGF